MSDIVSFTEDNREILIDIDDIRTAKMIKNHTTTITFKNGDSETVDICFNYFKRQLNQHKKDNDWRSE